MKATGIVRRIDDLGRVVIPKEIRRTMRIREGDPLEIFLEGNGVIFKKYDAYGDTDWVKALSIVRAVVPKDINIAIYNRDLELKAVEKLGLFDINGEKIDADFYATVKDNDYEPIAYIAFDSDNYEPSVAVNVLKAFLIEE